jgi:hypothetical protein
MKTTTTRQTIRSLDRLSATEPTVIHPDTEVLIPDCHIEWDGGKAGTATVKGARWTLRHTATDARVRDLVIG